MSKRRPEDHDDSVQADMLPVMNIMFLLIPALLLAMEFASMSQIPVGAPRVANLPNATAVKPPGPELGFKVLIGRDGFHTRVSEGNAGPGTIPLAGQSHDFAALGAVARDMKRLFPDESTVTITAEGDVPMHVLVETIDTLRGDGCKLGAWARGERPGDACLFWSPVIESVG